jgi:opacity protein-like surface antigen
MGRVDLPFVSGWRNQVEIWAGHRTAWGCGAVGWLATGCVVVLWTLSPTVLAGRAYLGVGTGIAYSPNERFTDTPVLLDYDLGFRVGALTLGYEFASGLRTELEAGYRRNELEIIEFSDARGVVNTGLGDTVDTVSLMANAIYQFDLGIPLRPYVGIGLGMARVDYELTVGATGAALLDDRESAFAYQALVGVGVPLGRRFQLSADYRYWGHAEIDLQTVMGEPVATDHPLHQVSLTLSYAFADNEPARVSRHDPVGAGWYSELRLGTAAAEDSDLEDGLPDTNFDAFDIGTALSVAVGFARPRASGGRWRAEFELSRWRNHADVIDFGKVRGEHRLSGPVDTLALAGNVIYDFAPWATLRPYAGLGVGFAEVDYDVTLQEAGVASKYVDDADSGFAVQALLGVGVRLSSRLEASLNYRYWWAPSVKLSDPQQVDLKTEHSAHVLMLGLRYRFND